MTTPGSTGPRPGTPADPLLGGPLGPPPSPPAPAPQGPKSAERPAAAAPAKRRGRAVGFTVAAALLIFVTVVLVLFVVFNTQTVRVSLVFATVDVTLIVALVAAAVLGGLVVGLASLLRAARRRRNT